jgi:hypothetical protein
LREQQQRYTQTWRRPPRPLNLYNPNPQGLVLIGPALHVWYGSLGSIVKAGGNSGALLRMAVDQLAFAPVFISSE